MVVRGSSPPAGGGLLAYNRQDRELFSAVPAKDAARCKSCFRAVVCARVCEVVLQSALLLTGGPALSRYPLGYFGRRYHALRSDQGHASSTTRQRDLNG